VQGSIGSSIGPEAERGDRLDLLAKPGVPGKADRQESAVAAPLPSKAEGPRRLVQPVVEALEPQPPYRREPVDRAQKREFVTEMHGVFEKAGVIVVAHYSGLTVAQMNDLRGRIRDSGAQLRVVKNRLAKLALEGTDIAGAVDLFQGPTVVAYSDDPVAAPKAAVAFAKQNDKLVVLGGAMGANVLDANGVKALAELPSLDELRGRLVGMVSTPASRIARILSAPGAQIARVIGAYADKRQAA
jgi:large subunit ribosomal protein L10